MVIVCKLQSAVVLAIYSLRSCNMTPLLRQQRVKGSDLSFAHAQSKHVAILLVVIVCEVLAASLSIHHLVADR